jgi:hypothetical protein
MPELLDWSILSNNSSVTTVIPDEHAFNYDLLNLTDREALQYGDRTWGINLVWTDPAKTDNIRFERQSGSKEPVKFEELVAISIRNGGFLVYEKKDTGINLSWSKTPKFEWKILGGTAGAVVATGQQVGLYSVVEGDSVMYESRDWGINLKWFKDSGKYAKYSSLIKAGETLKDWWDKM